MLKYVENHLNYIYLCYNCPISVSSSDRDFYQSRDGRSRSNNETAASGRLTAHWETQTGSWQRGWSRSTGISTRNGSHFKADSHFSCQDVLRNSIQLTEEIFPWWWKDEALKKALDLSSNCSWSYYWRFLPLFHCREEKHSRLSWVEWLIKYQHL